MTALLNLDHRCKNTLLKIPVVFGSDNHWIHDGHDYLDCLMVPTISGVSFSAYVYLLHSPNCFTVSNLCIPVSQSQIYVYLLHSPNCFTVSNLCTYIDLGSWGYLSRQPRVFRGLTSVLFSYVFTYILMPHNMIIRYFHFLPYLNVSNSTLYSGTLLHRCSITLLEMCEINEVQFSGVLTSDQCEVRAKDQGQRSKVKVTEVKTQLKRVSGP